MLFKDEEIANKLFTRYMSGIYEDFKVELTELNICDFRKAQNF